MSDCPTLKTDVKNFENMESATVSNSSTTDDSKEVKTTNDNETTVTHSAPITKYYTPKMYSSPSKKKLRPVV